MARWWLVLLGLAACERAHTYDLRGTVVEVRPPDHVVIEHDAIPGFMDAMTMPFGVADAALVAPLTPGDLVEGQLSVWPKRSELTALRVVAHVDPPPTDGLPEPIAVGQAFPPTAVALSGSESLVLGAPQPRAVLATFLYTRCPLPEMCPATVSHLQTLQTALLQDPVLLVAITLDPEHDTVDVLDSFATQVGATRERWRFARPDVAELPDLALRSGLTLGRDGETIVHGRAWVLIDTQGVVRLRAGDDTIDAARVRAALMEAR